MHLLLTGATMLQDEEADMPEMPEGSGQQDWGQEGQAAAANGGYTASALEQVPRQARCAQQAQLTQQTEQVHQGKKVDYEKMPRPSPYPLEGDIIAYRLLHIGSDWSPQVNFVLLQAYSLHGSLCTCS